jgi:hypothetical protein
MNKSATTLLDILGEFTCDDFPSGKGVYCKTKDKGIERLLDIRGWGFFQYYENGAEFQDAFRDWVTKAINEKYKQDKFNQSSKDDEDQYRPAYRRVLCCGTCKNRYLKSYTIGDVESRCSLDCSETWESYICDKFEETK